MGTDGETVGVDAGQAPATAPGEARLRVFLSYSRKDGDFVARLAAALDGPQFEASYDASPHAGKNPELGIAAEDEWWKQLERMIAAADAMVFVVSPDSIASKVCDEEILYARTMGKRVIAVLRREIDFAKAPPRLAALNVKLRFLDDSEAGFAASLAALSDALELDAAWWREQTWLAEQVKTWRDADADKRTDWLLSAAELARAERWAARRPPKAPQISEAELDFLAASRAHQAELAEEEARKLKVRRRLQLGVLAATVVALVITIGGGIFVVDRQRNVARTESLVLANVARSQAEAGAHASALRLSLLAARNSYLLPAMPEAEAMLARTSAAWRVEQEFLAKPGMTDYAQISEDGSRIVSWSKERADVTLWDARTGGIVATLVLPPVAGMTPWVNEARFADGVVLTITQDAAMSGSEWVAAWRADTGKMIWRRDLPLLRKNALVSGDGRWLVLAEDAPRPVGDTQVEDPPARILVLRIATGEVAFERESNIQFIGISDDGAKLALWRDDAIEVIAVDHGGVTNRLIPQFAQADGGDDPLASAVTADTYPEGLLFSPNGARLVAWTRDYGVIGWDLGFEGGARFIEKPAYRMSYDLDAPSRFEEKPGGVAFAADGESVMMWSEQGVARRSQPYLDDVSEIRAVQGGQAYVVTKPLPDGTGVLSVSSQDSLLRVWSFGKPEAPRLQLQHQLPLSDAIISADGTRVMTMDENLTATMWDLESGQRLARFRHDDEMSGYAFTSDGRVLTSGRGGVMRLWRRSDGVRVTLDEDAAAQSGEPDFEQGGGTFSHDGKKLLLWSRNQLAVADATTGKIGFHDASGRQWCVYSFDFKMRCGAAAVGGGERFAVWNGDVIALTPGAGQTGLQTLSDERRQGVAAVSADGGRVLGYGEDGVKVWDVATGKELFHVAKGETPYDAFFLGDGAKIAVWGETLSVRLFDGMSGDALGETAQVVPELVADSQGTLVISPDGRWALSDGGTLSDWSLIALSDKAQPRKVALPEGHANVIFSTEKDVFATWATDAFSLWTINAAGEAIAGDPIKTSGFLRAIRFSPDGRTVATLETQQVRLWRTGEARPFAAQAMSVPDGMEFSVDGTRLLAWDGGRSVLLDSRAGELVFETPKVSVTGASGVAMSALSADGARLVSMSPFTGERLYNVSAASKPASISTLREHVCGMRAGAETEQADVAPSHWRITADDVLVAPILRGWEGEDVCAWRPEWYDRVLGTLFGWVK